MGEARQRRQAARKLTLKIDSTDFARVASAVLRIGDTIFDVTTNQLPLKAKQLDAMDGGQTTAQWAPPSA